MKYFLKPLGHCLTTAMMTSAMLRCYAPPLAEAAAPEVDQPPPATAQSAEPDSGASQNSQLTTPFPVSPPETLPAESRHSSPSLEAISGGAGSKGFGPEGAGSGGTGSGGTGSGGVGATEANPSLEPAAQPDSSAQGQDAALPSDQQPAGLSPDAAFETAPAVRGADPTAAQEAEPVRTLAGMRQIVEKRLAAIVNGDKLSRETQWQQSLIYTTLQYAWTGRFDQARQVAQHPALSADLQAELLSKITMIQLERQPNQVAGAATKPPIVSITPGRTVPSGYTAGLPSGSYSYSSVSLGQQCPIAPVQPVQKSGSTASTPVAAVGKLGRPDRPASQIATLSGFPAFVPALSQSLADRLVRLSQLPAVSPAATPNALAKPRLQRSAIQPPEMFVGIASRLPLKQAALVGLPKNNLPKTNLPKTNLPKTNLPKTTTAPSSLRVAQVPLPPIASFESGESGEFRAKPLEAKPLEAKPLESKPSETRISALADRPAERQAAYQTGQTGVMPALWNLDQILGNALDQSLGQIGLSLPDWFSASVGADWSFWPDSTQVNPAQTNPAQTNSFGAASAQLDNSPLLLTLEQSLTAPQRDMRKLPSLLLANPAPAKIAKPAIVTASSSAKPVLYDAAALLAINCAQPLTHYSSDMAIDPDSSKRLGWVNLMFPLPIAAVLTSAFGWRVHPISGAMSFHTGIDLGAPMGTPVLAASAGRVVMADQMGGYGLAVVVEAGNQRNLYGHLSGIAVQPGAQVAQGAILGWVGSTGNSTGPHLHFESQVETSSGWTAVNPIASATLAAAK